MSVANIFSFRYPIDTFLVSKKAFMFKKMEWDEQNASKINAFY